MRKIRVYYRNKLWFYHCEYHHALLCSHSYNTLWYELDDHLETHHGQHFEACS